MTRQSDPMHFLGGETRCSGGFRPSVEVDALEDCDRWDTLCPLGRRKIAVCSCDRRGGGVCERGRFQERENDHPLYVGLEIAYVVELADVVAIH